MHSTQTHTDTCKHTGTHTCAHIHTHAHTHMHTRRKVWTDIGDRLHEGECKTVPRCQHCQQPGIQVLRSTSSVSYHMQVFKSCVILDGVTAVKIQTQRVPGTHSIEVVAEHSWKLCRISSMENGLSSSELVITLMPRTQNDGCVSSRKGHGRLDCLHLCHENI